MSPLPGTNSHRGAGRSLTLYSDTDFKGHSLPSGWSLAFHMRIYLKGRACCVEGLIPHLALGHQLQGRSLPR